jgi:hypothetical protein
VAAVVAALVGWYSHGRSDEGLEPDVDPYREHHGHGQGQGRGHAEGRVDDGGSQRRPHGTLPETDS